MGRQRLNWGLAVWVLGAGGCFSDPVSADDSALDEAQGSTGAVVSTTSDGSTTDLESSSASADEPSTNSSTGDVSAAEVRAVHASPSAGPVDVYLQGEDEPVFEGLEYGEASDRLEVPGGLAVFQFRQADASPASPPAYTSPELLLEDGDRITVVAAGVLGSRTPTTGSESFPSPRTGAHSFRVEPELASFTSGPTRQAFVSVVTSPSPPRSLAFLRPLRPGSSWRVKAESGLNCSKTWGATPSSTRLSPCHRSHKAMRCF